MTCLQINNLQAGYGDKLILNDINLSVEQGEMIALLGPSGCGKTTLLNALSGFVPVKAGQICVQERDITHTAPEKRNITMVFQSYALWPHMTVAQNIGYGLKVKKQSRAQIQARVQELLKSVKLEGLENERVTALSGGQRQRVALARALAVRPDVLVLDEPLSNLDAKVRLSVRHEIKALQKEFGFTSVIVTHDQEEALVMADRVAVMNEGRIEQLGTPEEIYQQPMTPFVADFMGADNRVEVSSQCEQIQQLLSKNSELSAAFKQENLPNPTQIYFRSEAVTLTTDTTLPTSKGLVMHGKIEQCAFLGNRYQISVRCCEQSIQASHHTSLSQGDEVTLQVPLNALHVFSPAGHSSHLFS